MSERPEKLYYSISEVAELTGVKPHVLRYWESEFPTLRPRKARSGSRSYRWRDVEEVLAIKKLLYEVGFRIAGARKLRREAHSGRPGEEAPATPEAAPQLAMPFADLAPREQLAHVRAELKAILEIVRGLKRPAAGGGAVRARK